MSETPNPIDLHVGTVMRALRKERGLSQQAVAATLGLTFQQVQKYERGLNRISASKLFETAKLLGVEVGAFFIGLPSPVNGEREILTPFVGLAGCSGGVEAAELLSGMDDGMRGAAVAVLRQLAGAVLVAERRAA